MTSKFDKPVFLGPAGICFTALIAVLLFSPAGAWPGVSSGSRIEVRGTEFLLNGKPWIAKGVTVVAFVAPEGHLSAAYAAAHNKFGESELRAISDYGADLIRFQVSQPGSDPVSPIYSASYLDQVAKAVHTAREHGFAVIVCLQSEDPSGMTVLDGLPDSSTARAWHSLARRFASDRGIMFELFNEPAKPRHSGPGGQDPSWSDWTRTTQPLIDQIRRDGAHNVLLADGLQWGHLLQGAPQLNDPDKEVAYAEHAFPKPNFRSVTDWDMNFGEFSKSHPVMITAWNARSIRHCMPDMPQNAAEFLNYAKVHRLGVVGWAFDHDGSLFVQGRMTSYRNFSCDSPTTQGAGELLHSYFMQK